MSYEDWTPEQREIDLKIDLAKKNGFSCYICDGTHFSFNGMGLVFCEECGVTYHVQVLDKVFNK